MVLIALGAFLAAFSPLLKFYVAPSVVQAPRDFWRVMTEEDDHASYFDLAHYQQRSDVPVQAITTVRGDPLAAKKDSIAVWDEFTVIKQKGTSNNITMLQQTAAFNRRTGGLVNCCGSGVNQNPAVKMSGLAMLFPVGAVEKKNYLYFDPTTLQAWPMVYQAQEKVRGVTTYRFQQIVPQTVVAPLNAIPAKYLGMPKDKRSLPVYQYYGNTRTVWVDPRTGIPVRERDQILTSARTADGLGQVTMASADLRTTPTTEKGLVSLSDDYAFTFDLVRGWGPVVLLIVGVVVLVGGVVVQTLAGGGGRGPAGTGGTGGTPPGGEVERVPGEDEDAPSAVLPGFRPGPPPSPTTK
jgi:hypothetical protein